MMDTQPESKEMIDFFKALGDADRLKIAGLLANEELTIDQIAAKLDLHPGKVANHLAHLETLGLVQKNELVYRLNTGSMEGKVRAVLSQIRPRTNPADFEGDEYDRKVLANYIARDGTLKTMPTQQKKLMAILRHAVKLFEPGVRYPEKQVNEILFRFHEDTASLRRYLVDNGLMTREKGIYWRTDAPAS